MAMVWRPLILSLSVVVGMQVGVPRTLLASEASDRAHKLEEAGDSLGARDAFVKAVKTTPNDPELLAQYAELLERYHDPAARAQYRKAASIWQNDRKPKEAASARLRSPIWRYIKPWAGTT